MRVDLDAAALVQRDARLGKAEPSLKALRPVATSTTSASIVSASPPLTGSKVTFAPFFAFSTPVTLAPSLKSRPCLVSTRWNCLATSPSMPPRIVSRYSTTVTLAPSRAQTEPSSSPMTPPPTTTMVAGTLANSSAPVDETITFSSNSTSTPGMPATSEPVAMTMFLASISSTLPSSAVTATLPAATTLPVPRKDRSCSS